MVGTPLLEVRDFHLALHSFDGLLPILRGLDLVVDRGEIWGLVGETGSGKSLTGLSIARLATIGTTTGSIRLDGANLLDLPERRMRAIRGRRIGMVFQDPTTNLNPAFTIGEQMTDVAFHAGTADPDLLDLEPGASRRRRRAAARALAVTMLDRVGISDAAARMGDYPHQFSGGMRQRVLIAMALTGRPDLLIADEPTTALDVLVQAQVLDLIRSLVRDYRLGVLFITHNLGVVAQLCSHAAVMYAGRIVESGLVADVLARPAHPYTRALLAAVPRLTGPRGGLQGLPGTVPPPTAMLPGCHFEPRCSQALPRCRELVPPPVAAAPGHVAACIRVGSQAACPA